MSRFVVTMRNGVFVLAFFFLPLHRLPQHTEEKNHQDSQIYKF